MQIGSTVFFKAIVVSRAWPECMLTWLFRHMVAPVGDLAGFFVVPLHQIGLLRPPLPIFIPLIFSVTGEWTPGVGRGGWGWVLVRLRGLPAMGVLLGAGAGWPASSGRPCISQAPNLHFAM